MQPNEANAAELYEGKDNWSIGHCWWSAARFSRIQPWNYCSGMSLKWLKLKAALVTFIENTGPQLF